MSSIFGIFYRSDNENLPEELLKMDASLAAFGPDGGGTWYNQYIGLGQRVMHFTPQDHHLQQPLKSADGQKVLVCDARVDNRQELARMLGVQETDTRDMPDADFIMQAYEKWGPDCAKHLIGDIAFALWDQRKQELLLARSPVGGRPLYYYSNHEFFAFASAPQGLFTLPAIARELNFDYLADYLSCTGVDPEQSFFNGISRLLPGQSILISKTDSKLRHFWEPNTSTELRLGNDQEYVEAFTELFDRVTSDHLRSTSPVGIMMSGGLDSTSIAAVAATHLKKSGQRLAAFTEVPRKGFDGYVSQGRYPDETPYIDAMTHRYDNIDANFIHTDGRTFLDGLGNFFNTSYIPFRNASNRTWYETILHHSGNQGVHVLLNGGQGNLTISRGGQGYLPYLLKCGRFIEAFREASLLHHRGSATATVRTLLSQGMLPLLPLPFWLSLQLLRGNQHISSFHEPWLEKTPIHPEFARTQRISEKARLKGINLHQRPSPYQSGTICRLITRMASFSNDINHAYRALYRVEKRDPTADVRIVEFCLSLPVEQFQKNGVSRRLIKRVMENKLPPEILENPKRGLQAADWLERLSLSKRLLLDTLGDWKRSPLVSTVIDLNRVHELVENLPQPGNISAMKQYGDKRALLDSALMTGAFIRWFEKGHATND